MTNNNNNNFNDNLGNTVKILRGHNGYNIIPVRGGTKQVRAGTGDVMRWKEKGCNSVINDKDGIAMLHGKWGGTWAIDLDDPGILDELFQIKKNQKKQMIVKTPKQGHHIIWSAVDDDVPPVDTIYSGKGGKKKIDIKGNGYTLLPPSVHPNAVLGKYQWLNPGVTKAPYMRWSNVEKVLNGLGYFAKSQTDTIKDNMSKFDYGALIVGGFVRGTRRVKIYSLYHKKRLRGSGHKEAVKECVRVAATCKPAVPEKELNDYMRIAERHYTDVIGPANNQQVVSYDTSDLINPDDINNNKNKNDDNNNGNNNNNKNNKKKKEPINHYALANVLMDQNQYLSHRSKEIFVKIGGVYLNGGHLTIRKMCRDLWEGIEIMSRDVTEIENIIREKNIHWGEFDSHPFRLVLDNGDYDADTGAWHKGHAVDTVCIVKHPVKYDPKAKCPRFNAILCSALNGDRERGMVLEMMAQCFVRRNMVQKGYVLHGIGHNGKSTFCNILRTMLGASNVCSIAMKDLQGGGFSGWELFGKSANISGDGGTESITHTTLLKKLLGGDAVKCEGKYRDPFDYVPYCTMIFTHNELPAINDSSDGFARKMQLIHFSNKFEGAKKDKSVDTIQYDDKELSGILNLLLPIIKRIITERSLEYEDDVNVIKSMWLKRSDSVYHFVSEWIELYPGGAISVRDCKQAYQEMCIELGMTAQSDSVLGEKMESICNSKPRVVRIKETGGTQRAWRGVRIVERNSNNADSK